MKPKEEIATLLAHYFSYAVGDEGSPRHNTEAEAIKTVEHIESLIDRRVAQLNEAEKEEDKYIPSSMETLTVSKTWRSKDQPFWQILGAALHHASSEQAAAIRKTFLSSWRKAYRGS